MARFLPCIVWFLQVSTYSVIVTEARPDSESSVKDKKDESASFVFPEPISRSGREIAIPADCKKFGICEDVPNYPEEVVSNIIKKIESWNITTIFNKDILEAPRLNNRFGVLVETMELCKSDERLYAPRGAVDENQDFYVIVNDKKKPQQKFRVELCQTEESTCSDVAYFSNGYEGRCTQKYMLRQMVAVKNNKEIVRHFRVPSVCSCVAVVP